MHIRTFQKRCLRTVGLWAGLLAGLLCASRLEGSHFRFGHLSWQRAGGDANSLTVEITAVEAWRKETSGPESLTYTIDHDGTTFSSQGATLIGTLTDLAGDEYEVYSRTFTHTFPSNGIYTVTSSQTFRLVDLVNAPATPVTLKLTLDLRDTNRGMPLTTSPIILQLPVDTTNSVAIPLQDPDGDPITVRFATAAESGIATLPSVGGNQMTVTPAGVIEWNTTGGAVGQRFAVQLAVEENHPGFTTTGVAPLEFMVELVEVATNQPPICSGPSGALNAQVGTPFGVAVSGSDPEGRPLRVAAQQLPPGAVLTPANGSTNSSPASVQLQWVPGLNDLGKSYPVTLVFTDEGGLQASCGFTIQVSSILPLPNFDLSSVATGGAGSGNGGSFNPVISRSARYVAFASEASNLAGNDQNGVMDVFLRDRGLTNTVLISSTPSGASGNGPSRNPVISRDGRFVAFESDASDLAAGDANGLTDVFIYDALSNRVELVSVNAAGTGSGNGISFAPRFSADGRVVAFVSTASDLAANDGNGTADVFVRRLDSATTVLVSVNSSGQSGAGASSSPVISTNGRFVAFASAANDLVAGDTNGAVDVFWRDLTLGETRLVSVNPAGGPANGLSYNPVISGDGFRVAFVSAATDLVSLPDTNQQSDVFLRDLSIDATAAVSRNAAGSAMGNAGSSTPVFSPDGKGVLFVSVASDLVAGDANGAQDVFLFRFIDPAADQTPLLPGTLPNAAVEAISLNAAGSGTGNAASGVTAASLSEDLRHVAFVSEATDLVAGGADANGVADVFVRDRSSGITRLASYDPDRRLQGDGASYTPFLSADGSVVVFATEAGNLANGDANGAADIVSTALTNDVPASVNLTTTVLAPETVPAGVEFPVVLHVSNLGDATVENVRVATSGAGAIEGELLGVSQGMVLEAGGLWHVGALPARSAASLTMRLRGTTAGTVALSSAILPPMPGTVIEGRASASEVVNILPPLRVATTSPVSYLTPADSPWPATGATRRLVGGEAMDGVSESFADGALNIEFNEHLLGAVPSRVGLVIPNAAGRLMVEAFDGFGRRLGLFEAPPVSGRDRFYGIESESGIRSLRVSGSGAVEVKELWLTVHSGVPVPGGLRFWGRGRAGEQGLIGEGYQLNGGTVRLLGESVAGATATVEFWLRPAADLDGATPWTPLVVTLEGEQDLAERARGLDVFYYAGALYASVPTGDAGLRTSLRAVTDLPADRWHHVAGVLETGRLRLFLNGQLVAERALSGPASLAAGQLAVGQALYAGSLRRFAGALDEVSVYDRALPGETIAALHDQSVAGKVRPRLTLRDEGDRRVIEWPAFFPGYQVYGAATLGGAQGWHRWPAHPPVIEGVYRVFIPAMSGYRYFRLARPD